ncbi:autophagy-like protein 22 [Xylona heveae TC161]|uniref:Autophagy-related protein n=1 Tax=Xylona heveae (strain CBS 132557 / TC161) TaxID=1328760 RepID=A0A165GME6_XYLHT|nr:autophagy-like protein 22 [Xylona heveae TC161]KZF22368.1 autophagy-like protein 22 [Xylona heveae TC161]
MVPRYDHQPRPPPFIRSNTKASLVSPSPSVEGDDERSYSDPSMGPDEGQAWARDEPEYEGEDTRTTSTKELAGWFSYGWAAEVFVVCGVGSFIPITLEQLARERGHLLSDSTKPCTSPDFPASGASSGDSMQCVVSILGTEINTASFAMYTFSISVALQALLIISMSGAADHGTYRKTLLLSFAFTGAVATMLFLPIVPGVFLLGALLAIIANTCFGASFVLLNSFLPLLVRHHSSLRYTPSEGSIIESAPDSYEHTRNTSSLDEAPGEDDETIDSRAALLPETSDSGQEEIDFAAATSAELRLSTTISAYGIGIGYTAAVLVQVLSIVILILLESTTFALRLVLFVVGAWWLIFSIPAAMWLRPRPGPPLPAAPGGKARTWLGYFVYAWKSLGRSVMHARQLKDILLFLAAWFLLSDGIATVSGTAVLFAKTQLGMKAAALGLINVIVTVFGVLGAFTWSKLSRWLNWSPSQTVLACICLFELIPLYGLLGFIPAIRRYGVFGLQQPWEMYPLGAVYGLVLGGLSSYCRSLFGELIPPGFEASFYALYAITDKGSSVLGPTIVGAITDATGEIRPAFWFLAVLIALPAPAMWLVDVERGRKEGAAIARELEGRGYLDRSRASDGGVAGDHIVMIDEEAEETQGGT